MSVGGNGQTIDIAQYLCESARTPDVQALPRRSLPDGSDDELGEDVFTNVVQDRQSKVGRRITELAENLFEITDGFPKRLGPFLFARTEDFQPLWLDSPQRLFAWIDSQQRVVWTHGAGIVPQERFFAYLETAAERYDALELVPHWPPLRNTYYLHPSLPTSDGSYLDNFLARFSPATNEDRQLLRGLAASLFWGGPPGDRPAWLITADEGAGSGRGRGTGKSSVPEWFANLAGGFMEFSPSDSIEQIKKRLLSPEARTLRVGRLDNIKANRFSWADLEGLITSPVISGHRMFKGEGRRPNTLTWLLTINGPAFSTDLAERSIMIKLASPTYTASWKRDLDQFLTDHRWHVISDIGRLLTEN